MMIDDEMFERKEMILRAAGIVFAERSANTLQ